MPDASHERAQRLTGIALMCGAVACFALLDTTAKYLNLYMATLQVVWARYTGAFLFPLIVSNPWTVPGLLRTGRPALQIGRSFLLLGSTIGNFLALRYLQLDEAIAIIFSTPFFVAALSGPMLGEWVRLAALDRDRRRLHRRAGGDAAGLRRRSNRRRCSRSRRRSATRSIPSSPAFSRAPIPTRPRCSIRTWSAWWS